MYQSDLYTDDSPSDVYKVNPGPQIMSLVYDGSAVQ